MKQIYSPYSDFIKNRETQGLKRHLRSFSPAMSGRIVHDGVDYIDFSSNDYLGLKYHPDLIVKSKEALGKYGNSVSASRVVTGGIDLYDKLETKIANWKNKEATLLMNAGFQCNASVLPALFDRTVLGEVPLVFSDKLIHASMHQGCLTAGIKQIRFRHNDVDHLMRLLGKYKNNLAPKFILTESVFSMDGDIAPLEKFYELRDKYNACLIVDEAHAVGVLGENGRGLADKADIVIGTCGKALGSFGSYVAADQIIVDYLIQNCKGFIYSTALPPSVVAAIDTAIDLLPFLENERQHVLNLAEYFRKELKLLGFDCGASKTQIVPLILSDIEKTMDLSLLLKKNGFWTASIRPPTVPAHTSRIRFSFSASHSMNDVETLLKVIKQI